MEVVVEEKALNSLLDAFGPMFSLEEIASAYSKAGQKAELAGKILYSMLENNSTGEINAGGEPNSEAYSESFNSTGYCEPLSTNGDTNSGASKRKGNPVSMGSVSSFMGNKYAATSRACKGVRPLKSEMHEWMKHSLKISSPDPDVRQANEFENFLFEMLKHGFQVEKDVIQEVLGQCGYDINKSLEKLLDISADHHYSKYEQNEVGLSDSRITADKRQMQSVNDSNSDGARSSEFSGIGMSRRQQERYELEREVLSNLFTVPGRPKFPEKIHPVGSVRRSTVSRNLVVEPLKDTDDEPWIRRVSIPQDDKEDQDEEYFVLRQAVKEYRATMNEYYKAAAEAFAKGDRARSFTLLEKGRFFYMKAREADEESAKKIFSSSDMDEKVPEEIQEAMSLNIQNLVAKEALRLIKCHLRNFSGMALFKYLRIINGTDEEDASKDSRRLLVIKLLERESIKWKEEGDSATILICLDEINPKRLSFARKQ